RHDVVVARAAYDGVALQVAHGPRQHLAAFLAFQGVFYVFPRAVRIGHGSEEQLPEPAVRRRLLQALLVVLRKRLQADAMAFERLSTNLDHPRRQRPQAAPRSKPSLRNMSRMPRAAWRRRCSFSMSAMRTWSSP